MKNKEKNVTNSTLKILHGSSDDEEVCHSSGVMMVEGRSVMTTTGISCPCGRIPECNQGHMLEANRMLHGDGGPVEMHSSRDFSDESVRLLLREEPVLSSSDDI